MSALSSRRVSVHVPGGGGTKAAFSRRSAFFSGMRPLHRTAVKKSSSSSRRPKNAGRRRMISSSSSRDLFEGDEGFDVELLQKDLVEEGLLDQKHANGYVKEFSRYLSFSSFSQRPKNLIFEPLLCVGANNTDESLFLPPLTITKQQTLQRPNDRGDRDASATVRFTRHRRMD